MIIREEFLQPYRCVKIDYTEIKKKMQVLKIKELSVENIFLTKRHLQINQISMLNYPWGVDMPLNKPN